MNAVMDSEMLGMLGDSLLRYRSEQYTFEHRSRWLEQGMGYSPDAWREYANLGWLTLALPEEQGGFGNDPCALALLAEYTGAALALEPVFASAILCGRVLARRSGQDVTQHLAVIEIGRAHV